MCSPQAPLLGTVPPRSRLSLIAVGLSLAVLLSVLTGVVTLTSGPVWGAVAPSLKEPTRTVAQLGARVQVAGQLPGGSRTVQLQLATATGWRTVARTTSDTAGRFSLPVPTGFYGLKTVRAYAPAATGTAAVATTTRRVTVQRAYTPRGSSGSWARLVPGVAARWNPCKPILWRLNTAGAPAGAKAEISSALSRVRAATGLVFKYAGTSRLLPWSNRSGEQFPAQGIVFAWTTASQVSRLAGSVAGVGGGRYLVHDTRAGRVAEMISGGVVLDRADRPSKSGYGAGFTRGSLLMHEIGHAVGLGHVSARSQLMYPSLGSSTIGRYGAGDLAGLRAVGAEKGCL